MRRLTMGHLLRFVFANYLWFGIVLLVASIAVEKYFPDPKSFAVLVGLDLLATIGIAVVVASIFTFASGTSEFVDRIRALLQDIVIDRDFLGNIENQKKRDALRAIIKPSTEEKKIYSNIEDYYNVYITQTLNVSQKCVRSNYSVNCRAYIDKDLGRVAVDGAYSYRLYPTADGYADIRVAFNEGEQGTSRCRQVVVAKPDGTRKIVTEKDLALTVRGEDGSASRQAVVDLRDIGRGHDHLDIQLNVTEYGEDHWILLTFQALQPTDGFKFELRAESPLEVRTHATFVVGASYYVDRKSTSEIMITCTQWINEGTGLCIVVALPHNLFEELPRGADQPH